MIFESSEAPTGGYLKVNVDRAVDLLLIRDSSPSSVSPQAHEVHCSENEGQRGGEVNPYCVVRVDKSRAVTQVQWGSHSPTWHETFTFFVKQKELNVNVEVWNKGLQQEPDQYLGSVSWPCSALDTWEELHFDKTLEGGKSHGRVIMNLRWIEITPPVHPEDKWFILEEDGEPLPDNKGKLNDDERKGEWCDRYGFWHESKLCSREYFYDSSEKSPGTVPSTYLASATKAARYGVPFCYKIHYWKIYSDFFVKNKQNLGVYANMTPILAVDKQISIDLPRIWPAHPAFHAPSNHIALNELRSLLRAISNAMPALGYCQSMGPIAAALLLLTDKQTAFELSMRLFDQITPDYHSATMEGLQIDIQVLMVLVKNTLPSLHAHFEELRVDVLIFASKWFMRALPYSDENLGYIIYKRLRGLGIFKMNHRVLLKCTDFMEVNNALIKALARLTNWDKLISVIFSTSFPSLKQVIFTRKQVEIEVKARLDKSAVHNIPERIRQGLSIMQLETMRAKFNQISQHGVVTRDQFSQLFDGHISELLKDQAFEQTIYGHFDKDGDDHIDWKEYCVGLSFISAGTLNDKIAFWFKTFDINGDGRLEKPEVEKLFQWKLKVLNHPHDRDTVRGIVKAIWKDTYERRRRKEKGSAEGENTESTDSGDGEAEEIDTPRAMNKDHLDEVESEETKAWNGAESKKVESEEKEPEAAPTTSEQTSEYGTEATTTEPVKKIAPRAITQATALSTPIPHSKSVPPLGDDLFPRTAMPTHHSIASVSHSAPRAASSPLFSPEPVGNGLTLQEFKQICLGHPLLFSLIGS